MSDSNIYTNGEYLKKNSTWNAEDSSWKSDMIIELMRKNNLEPSEVIEVGCGAGMILEKLSQKCPFIKLLRGFDISPQAIEMAKKHETRSLYFYNEDITLKQGVHADILLLIDVVEHLEDFYGFLKKIRPMSEYFIFHIPLDLSLRTIFKPHVMQQQRQAVGHIHYFSEEMVLWSLEDCGFEVMQVEYTKPVVDVQRSGSFKRWVKKTLRNISFRLNKKVSVKTWGGYSLLILAK